MTEHIHYRTCPLCEAMCGLAITVADNAVKQIRGDQADPLSRGHICPKGSALGDIHHDPDRLRQPLQRQADGWHQIGWDEAFDYAATQLKQLQARYGPDAIAIYQGNPSVHNLGTALGAGAFVRSLRTKNRFSASSVDQLPHQLVVYHMYGHQLMLPVPDLDRTQFLLIFGANPAVSNGSIMSAPDIKRRLKAIQQRGGQIVVFDPRQSETAQLADQHYFIQPGSDGLVLAALIHTMLKEGWANPDRLAGFTNGLDLLESLFERFSPAAVAEATGVATDTILQLAHDFSQASSAVCYGRIGVSVQQFGTLSQWLIQVLNIITGNLDREGGSMFTTPAFDTLPLGSKGNVGRWHTRVRHLPEFAGELPSAALAEEILTPGEGQIRGLITSAGNPVLSTPNGQQLDQALAGLEFMLSIDFYLNETTRHAHLILPPSSPLEHDHYDVLFHNLAIRNTAKYSPALFEIDQDARHDWQIFGELTQRMSEKEGRIFPPKAMLERGLRSGPYAIQLSELAQQPHGIDLGPLQPRLPERLFTEDKQIQLVPPAIANDLDRLAELLQQAPTKQLRLISRRQLRSNNSWMHNSQRLVKGDDRCTLQIHPADAAQRQLSHGQQVKLSSRVGTIEVALEVSDLMMPGVVSLPHGWGHRYPDTKIQIAQAHAGSSINDLTDDQAIDPLSGNAALNGIVVEVQAIG